MYWFAQVEPRRERLASNCLGLAGYEIYQPLLREQRPQPSWQPQNHSHAAAVPRLPVRVGSARLVGCAMVAGCGSSHHGWFVAGARS
jgi:hypothetical protein